MYIYVCTFTYILIHIYIWIHIYRHLYKAAQCDPHFNPIIDDIVQIIFATNSPRDGALNCIINKTMYI
jgi:hypothetical protein